MKNLFYILFIFYGFGTWAQDIQEEDPMDLLIAKYSSKLDIKCDIEVKIDVEGMVIPDKQIYVEFNDGKKPIVKGKGLSLLPKKGIVGQFNELLSTPLQAIFLSKKGEDLIYKIVSLDQKSDWITADIRFDEDNLIIHEATINTRKQGTFFTEHFYKESKYPSKSIIKFNIQKFSIPLKFVGRAEKSTKEKNNDKEVLGTITLLFTYLE